MAPVIDRTLLIEDALREFQNQTGIEAVVTQGQERTIDAEIVLKRGTQTWRFLVEVKPWLTRDSIGILQRNLQNHFDDWLLVTRHVGEKQADELRVKDVAFLDATGNGYINRDNLYVFIKGREATRELVARKGELLRPAELKVLFAFLCLNGLVARTHTEIKAVTGVGLGTINRLIRGLEFAGHILNLKGKTRRLVRKKELLEQWVIAYPLRLRAKQLLGTYRTFREGWWVDADPDEFGLLWGGEIAAHYLTRHLKPQMATIYVIKQPHELVVKHKLQNDPKGNVEILRRFWNFPPTEGKPPTVPPLLVYADLLATGDDRNIETARMIYEDHLAGLVREG